MPPQDHSTHLDKVHRPEPIYVLFEGPWWIFESAPGFPTLTAVTVGAQMDDEEQKFVHSCLVATWHHGEPTSSTTLPAGDQWFIRARDYRPKPFSSVIANAYADQNIAWIPTGCSSHVYPGDRSVILPVPTSMHFAGILKNAKVSGKGILQKDNVPPHVVTILKYEPKFCGEDSPSITLHQGDCCQPIRMEAGTHLIFRLRHTGMMGPTDSADHVTQAFTHLRTHLSKGDSIGFQFTGDSSFDLGDSQGLSFDELGLDPDGHGKHGPMAESDFMSGEFANCCGGGGASGGGQNNPPPLDLHEQENEDALDEEE